MTAITDGYRQRTRSYQGDFLAAKRFVFDATALGVATSVEKHGAEPPGRVPLAAFPFSLRVRAHADSFELAFQRPN